MFELTHNVRAHYRALAILVAASLVFWSAGLYATTAQAANLVEVENLISDSAPGATNVTHTVSFTIPSDTTDPTTEVTITFPAGFDVDGVTAGSGSTGSMSLSDAGQDVIASGFTANANDEVVVEIEGVENTGTVGSYEITLATDAGDTGATRIVIIDTVTVTAEIDTVFDFVISGTTTGVTVNGVTTTGDTTATEIDFETLSPNTEYMLAQQLNVTTNAGNGFVVTVESDTGGNLVSATGAEISQFVDGDAQASPQAWDEPANDVLDDTTWGHWGLTSADGTLSGSSVTYTFGSDEFIAVTGSPQPVFYHGGPSDGVTEDIGQTLVGYKIEVTPLQQAADDYQTTLTYIATPTF